MTADPVDAVGSGISVLGTAQRDAWQSHVLPPVERLEGGLWSVPVPIPDNPLRYTLCYLVPGDDGIAVVDPGWNTDEGWQLLLAGLAEAGAGVNDVRGIVVTHVHPDHHGLSARLRTASGAWVAMHPAERDTLPQRVETAGVDTRRRDRMVARLILSGVPENEFPALMARFDRPDAPKPADMADPDVLLEDGDLVPLPGRRLSAVWTPGHTPGHLCLRELDSRLLLTGDHVLPRITPNIGLVPNQRGDAPLRWFLDSLDLIGKYDDHQALPAHEYRFTGLAARTRQLRAHHQERCEELLAAVDELGSPTLWQLAERLTWSRPWAEVGTMRIAALSETAAHADYLVEQGDLRWAAGAGLGYRLRDGQTADEPTQLQRV